MGLLCEPDSAAITVLKNFGLSSAVVFRKISSLAIGASIAADARYERFGWRAWKVVVLACTEARRLNHDYIGTEHLLLGLIKQGSGVGTHVLTNLAVDPRKIQVEIEKLVKRRPGSVRGGELPQTPRATRAIELAILESRALNHETVETEHLLLGLLRENEGVAAQVLANLGLQEGHVREEVLKLLDSALPWSDPAPAYEDALKEIAQKVRRIPELCAILLDAMAAAKEQSVVDADYERALGMRDLCSEFEGFATRLKKLLPEPDRQSPPSSTHTPDSQP